MANITARANRNQIGVHCNILLQLARSLLEDWNSGSKMKSNKYSGCLNTCIGKGTIF